MSVEPNVPDDLSFVVLAGSAVKHSKEIKDAFTEMGFDVIKAYNIDISEAQAREFMEAQIAASKVRADDIARAEAEAAKGKKGAPAPKKPGKGDVPPAAPYDQVLHEEELTALIETRVAFFALRKGDGAEAVNEVRSIVGPEDPMKWGEFPDCLRSRFSNPSESEGADGGPASEAATSASLFNTIFTAFTPQSAREIVDMFQMFELQDRALKENHQKVVHKKSDRVSVDQLIAFCFPPGEIYPRSTGRLIVFALYGPFNEEGNLTCGFRGSHVLSSVELESMIDDIDEEDIVSVYVPSKGLSTYEKLEVLRSSDTAAKRLPTMSRAQVSTFLGKLPADSAGTISFHDLQDAVQKQREKRLQEMKRMYPTITSASAEDESSALKAAPAKFGRRLGKPSGEIKKVGCFFDPKTKIGETETFRVVSKLLAQESHNIAQLEDGNSSSLTQNVRLLRDVRPIAGGGWDDNCCVRGTVKGSYSAAYKKK